MSTVATDTKTTPTESKPKEISPDAVRWLTRDSDHNGLGTIIDVWLEKPDRDRLPGGGAMWLGAGTTGLEQREMQCTVEYAIAKYRTIPESDREMIKIG